MPLPPKSLVFVICLLPLAWLVGLAAGNALGPDPGQSLVLFLGLWALYFLLLALAVSPLRQWLRLPVLLRYRRMLGLYSFFYASLHLLAVATYLVGWDWVLLTAELRERPYMLVGFAAWLSMLPLVATSNNYMVRKLGRRWAKLQRLVYVATAAALIHVLWQIRSDYGEVLLYTALAVGLMFWRLLRFRRSR